MKPIKFTFDDTPAFDGFSHESKWNGFDNVCVTSAVREQVAAYFENDGDIDGAADIRSIEPMENGLVSFGWGYTTSIVDDYADVLAQLAACDGAILYWQTDKSRFKPALDAGIIRQDGELLVHPEAITIEFGMAYTMPEAKQ